MSFIERLKQRTQQRFADAERRVLERRQQQAPAPTPPAPQRPAGIQQLLKAFQPTIEAMRPITEPLAEIARPIVEPLKTPPRIRIRTREEQKRFEEEQREAQADNWFARMLIPRRVERTGNILQDTLANVQRGLETPAARAVMEPFVAISKGAGGAITGDIIPRRGETPREFYKRQPQLGEVVSRELEKTGIPVLPIVGGFLAEALLPPYGVGGAGRFADDIIKATTLNAKENIIKRGIRGITDDEATTLARTLTPIKNKRTVQKRLDDFVRARQQTRVVAPTPEALPTRAITPPTPVFRDEGPVTTRILRDLEGRSSVSKQYILDATNRPEVKQVERDIIRNVIDSFGDTVPVQDFANKVKTELLPLTTKKSDIYKGKHRLQEGMLEEGAFTPKYEETVLPDNLRGRVQSYRENIYESPIKTKAGQVHFAHITNNYYGHTRIEDLTDGTTRRVIEVQSDLYQKRGMEQGVRIFGGIQDKTRKAEIAKLQQYTNPTAHFRMIREEIKNAAQDGKTRLKFPTGETAMKIEGLGEANQAGWRIPGEGPQGSALMLGPETANKLKIGLKISNSEADGDWVITEVLGDGKFKAVSKLSSEQLYPNLSLKDAIKNIQARHPSRIETFDISGKIDTENPIYRFYEKEVAQYLKRYGGQRVTDPQGVSWIEIDVPKSLAKVPVEAFGAAAGIEQDEEGRIRFDPEKAMLGVAGIAGISRLKRIREKARVGVVPPLEVPPAVGVMTPEAPLVRNIDLPLEKIDHIKPPTKRPPSLEKLGLRKKPDLITRPEDVLLRERIRAQARGAKEAAKAGRVLTRDALRLKREGHEKAITELRDVNKKVVQSLKDETKNIAQKKQAIVDYAKDKLPLDLRGKLISAVSRATSEGDVASAVRRINILRNEEIKKDVVKNIEDIIKNIDALPPNQQRRILEETEGITLSSFSPETQKKLGELKDFISQKPEAVYRFGAKTIKKAERTLELGKIPLKEVPLRDIINKSNRLSFVLEEGKLMNKITGRIKDLKVQNALREVAESNPVNLDRGLPPPRKPGDPIPMTSFSGVRDDTIEAMRKGTQYYVSPDVGFSIFDNDVLFGKVWQTFKHPADLATDLTNKMRNKTIDDLFENVKNIEAKHGKLKVENYENVTLYAALRQTGGRAKLQKSDPRIFTDTFLDSIKLSDGEMEFYNLGRSIFDELRPQIEDVLWKTRGEKLGKVDNYWSWMTDFENSDELFMRLSGDYNLTSRTAQGFTKSRVLGASDRINLNALDVLVKHINDASMFIHQEELLNHLGKIARSDEFTKSVGEMGQRWTLGWIDLLSRGGTPKGYRPGPLTQVIHNIGHGVLGFRLSPVVKQPLAKVVSYGYLGNTLNIDKEFFTNPSIRDALHKISAQQKYRSFDDPAYTALAKNKRLVDWQKKGYQAIKTVDSYMADSVWYAAYRTNLEKRKIAFNLEDFRNGKNIDDKAKIYADYVVRRTQGSSEFKDAPLMYATQANRDSVIALLQFQRFVHNQSMLWRDAKTALIKEKDPIKAASISTALVAAGLANSYITTGMAQIFSSEDTAKREREKAISRRFFDAIVGQIPVVSNIVSVAEFEGTGIPVADVLRRGVLESPKMFTAETPEARMRAATRVAESAAIIGGISGAGQAGQIVRRLIPAPRKAPRRGPLSMPSLRMPRTELPSLKLPRQ